MSVRNELETLLSISQGTEEDYGDYILRVLEEINAVEDSIFNTMTKDTIDWVNDGILAYNGNQPIPEFPKTVVRVKVEPIIVSEQSTLVESLFEQESVLNIPDELQSVVDTQFESIPEQVYSPEIETEVQETIGSIEKIIPDVVSLPEIKNEVQEGINTELILPEQELDLSTLPMPIFISNEEEALEELEKMKVIYEGVKEMLEELGEVEDIGDFRTQPLFSEPLPNAGKMHYREIEREPSTSLGFGETLTVKKKRGRPKGTKNKPIVPEATFEKTTVDGVETELTNEEFRKQEDELFNNSDILEKQINNSDVPEKKKRGRPKGTKNKEDKLLNKISVMEPEFTENEPFHFEIGASDIPVKKKRGRKPGTKNKPKITTDEHLNHPVLTEELPILCDVQPVAEPSKEDIGEQVIKNNFPPSEYDYKLVAESMDMGTGEITPEFEITKKEFIVPEGAITEQDIKNIESELNYPIKVTRIKTDSYFIPSKEKPQKPLDLFRILVCQNYYKPFEEIFKLAENQSIDIKKSTALVTCSTIKAAINTLRSLGMLKEEICK